MIMELFFSVMNVLRMLAAEMNCPCGFNPISKYSHNLEKCIVAYVNFSETLEKRLL